MCKRCTSQISEQEKPNRHEEKEALNKLTAILRIEVKHRAALDEFAAVPELTTFTA